ncbi:hypothetical protein WN71_028180 [Streptomyces mangrovisoli]|uniref:Uncharacterized protein n=1 Tax=Streptomyces mangrovisoli TaxID=1428628 RepID=A0A1J4NQI7_9ACTN|nr:hypothetical protein WN71_028180 [Streptomyces mangrovisoli]
MLSFHSRVGEAEAMAVAVRLTAARLAGDDPEAFPPAPHVWSAWLCGEYAPAHRRQVLEEFARDFLAEQDADGHPAPPR